MKYLEIMQLSDLVVILLTVCLIQNFLFLGLWALRGKLLLRIAPKNLDRLLKGFLVFMLFCLPLLAGFTLYKTAIDYIGEPLFEESLSPLIAMHYYTISVWTDYGNHWIFALTLLLWLGGAFCKAARPWLKERRILRLLRGEGSEAPDAQLEDLLREQKEALGLRREIRLRQSSLVQEPFVLGTFRPCIFFPQGHLEDGNAALLLRHELVHCRKRDVLYRRFLFALSCLYWFIPLLKQFAHWFVEVSEMACDAEVLKDSSREERVRYSQLLVLFSQGESPLTYATALTGHRVSSLERRLQNMINMQKKNYLNGWRLAALTAALVSCCPLTVWAAATGVSAAQHYAVESTFTDVEEEMKGGNTLTEYTDDVDMGEMRDLGLDLQSRSASAVDTTLNGKETVKITSVTVKAGSKITFVIYGDKATDSFRAGYRRSSGTRTYVSTSSGEINHTFTISEAGTYTLFIEGTSNKTVHVSGSVIVR